MGNGDRSMIDTRSFNPDVLSCLANLSNDEVFTPPKLANEILDLLPQSLWSDKAAKFLDPCSKTGVFLREIAKRLLKGLEKEIPNLSERINHIFKNQLYGIAITELTAHLTRRSVYCSKHASGKYSVCNAFDDDSGNIRFERIEHTWKDGKCVFCGANQENYDRGDKLETHAYQFIHTKKPEEIFNMKFDVIIGNPPYQLSDGGYGRSASPIFNKFVEQAKKMRPRYLTMIIPDKWFAGGKGLDSFRETMLNDKQIRKLVDYADSKECFQGPDIPGGICYFLWEKDSDGLCEVTNIQNGEKIISGRQLNEFSTFIRYEQAAQIVRKIMARNKETMDTIVSSRKPFGLATNIRPLKSGDIILRYQNGEGSYQSSQITTGKDLIKKWKVMTSKTSYDHAGLPDKEGKRRVLSRVEILRPGYICTETYILLGSFETKAEASNCISYATTKLVRFLVAQLSFSQDITKDRFAFVPMQDFSESWTDEKLYKKYGLTQDEIAFIESMIRPMEITEGENV
ncbi:MAG: Eco57I restriction-modification methylase domain-containing protein [Dysgonamonadaceae bacterium]|jgi:site-specific DNA-methyltransferase (adenine-specific)|nr:Eco57I restriction-modification methylase domain-containing protein [Dysgonamonadaceae bacterium]